MKRVCRSGCGLTRETGAMSKASKTGIDAHAIAVLYHFGERRRCAR